MPRVGHGTGHGIAIYLTFLKSLFFVFVFETFFFLFLYAYYCCSLTRAALDVEELLGWADFFYDWSPPQLGKTVDIVENMGFVA